MHKKTYYNHVKSLIIIISQMGFFKGNNNNKTSKCGFYD
jgi:hypothetical protein